MTTGSHFEGTLVLDNYSYFCGQIRGKINGTPGSTLVLGENGIVEGNITGDTVIIDGFVRGEITATTKIIVSETGRVIGGVNSPSFAIRFGGYFEGRCRMS